MLVISRSDGQEIVIVVPGRDDPIIVRCCTVSDSRARIGITAAPDIRIDRREIHEARAQASADAKAAAVQGA